MSQILNLRVYKCKECNNDYTPRAGNQIFCSDECRITNKANNNSIKRYCANSKCNKEFSVIVQSDHKKYCSSSCAAHVNNQVFPKRKVEGTCLVCSTCIPSSLAYCEQHKMFGSYEQRIEDKKCFNVSCNKTFKTIYKSRKYCSYECKEKTHKAEKVKDEYKSNICPSCKRNKNKSYLVCKDCGKNFYANKRVQQWLNGEWAGGSEHALSISIRKYVIEQAEYQCKVCGWNEVHPDDGKPILEVNHIDGNGNNHRPENLEVLCPNHHAMTSTHRNRNKGNGRKFYYVRVKK